MTIWRGSGRGKRRFPDGCPSEWFLEGGAFRDPAPDADGDRAPAPGTEQTDRPPAPRHATGSLFERYRRLRGLLAYAPSVRPRTKRAG